MIGFKPVGSEGGTGSFKNVKGFPSCFNFVIAFLVDQELAFLSIYSILKNFFNCPLFLSEASMVTGTFEADSGSPRKALRSGLR